MCGCVCTVIMQRRRVSAEVKWANKHNGGSLAWEAEKNRYSLGPVGDVAKHEAASVIGQPADHEGNDHRSWTQGREIASEATKKNAV